VEVRNYRVCHVFGLLAAKARTIKARHCDFHRSGVKKAAM
jgi:hypothetical protein